MELQTNPEFQKEVNKMIELKQHPILKELIPPLTEEEYQGLKNDIQNHGIQVPIIRSQEGYVIDGWHRYLIAKELDIEPKMVEREFVDNIEMGISLNLRRRHLSIEQRNQLIVVLREKGWTQKRVAETLNVDQSTVSKMVTNMKTNNGDHPDLRQKVIEEEQEEIRNEIKAGESERKIAKKHKISKSQVHNIKKKPERKDKKERIKRTNWIGYGDKFIAIKKLFLKLGREDQGRFYTWVVKYYPRKQQKNKDEGENLAKSVAPD